ncbi:MutS-related protein [Sphingobacterium rhinopitheci]|uniref:MutS-related protein n=1 Tax=Sphingobacterium rhinopitheci TaxID=2781960 RepID=UPI001F519A6A|nr:DNA mismatch repair protein MutS [Sphingobacterium rhinopitheci]MCI0920300.1 DNA mismatch repair protein MutS [Sphingobacterium rhinopitheci]
MNEFYYNNIKNTEEVLISLEKQINRNSLFRLAVIIGGSIILFQIFQTNNVWLLLLAVFLILILFAFLVRRQSQLEKNRDENLAFLRVNKNEVSIIEGELNMYDHGVLYDNGKHPYVSDLDIFGPNSVFNLVNRAATADGVERLASWFLAPSSKDVIVARQEAAAELANKHSWSQRLQTKLLFNLGKQINIKTFLSRYLSDDALKFGSSFLKVYVAIAPYLFVVGTIVSLIFYPVWNYMLLLAIVHLMWTLALAGKVSYFSNRIDKVGVTLIAYADAIKMLEDEQFESTYTKDLQISLKTDKSEKLSIAFKTLGSLVDKLDARNNILVGALLNMIFLWDFRQVLAIVNWKNNYEGDVLKTFDIVADFESLVSLATLKRNSPQWTTPTIMDNPLVDRIHAIQLNHPLIPKKNAVANDYDASSHRLALITGSNMAGKSTFLRTLGVNAVLAYAGAVVCAEQLSLPIYKLVSYMRIKDNLNESTSTFKAELDRMKFILELVAVAPDSFVLIDEMLRGTNSVDKYLGSRAIIKKLISMNGMGMVATHDLQLATLEDEYESILKNYHFDIQVIEGEMLFDYKLKNGKCTVFNASMLLKGIGIDVES